MTAEEARAITAEALRPDSENVKALLEHWYKAIAEMAKQGERSCLVTIPNQLTVRGNERDVAVKQLQENGFKVQVEPMGGFSLTVSW